MGRSINPEKFKKAHELHSLGLDAKSISIVMKNQGFSGCSPITVKTYLEHDIMAGGSVRVG